MDRWWHILILILLLLMGTACSAPQKKPRFKRTCVALSVGAFDGIAHIGALQAIEEAGISIDCISGTSMGALVGGLYAERPNQALVPRMERIWNQATKLNFFEKLGLGLRQLLTGESISKADHGKFVAAIRAEIGVVNIEQLDLPFVTTYATVSGTGLQMEAVRTGDLVNAIGGSTSNGLIFRDLERLSAQHRIDPGVDRIAAVPVQLTCDTFPDARIIAVNVTGKKIMFTESMKCPLIEIAIPPATIPVKEIVSSAIARRKIVHLGYLESQRALLSVATSSDDR